MKRKISWIPDTGDDKSGQGMVKNTIGYERVTTGENCWHCDYDGSYGGITCCMFFIRNEFIPGHLVFPNNRDGHCQNWKEKK